MVEEEAVDGAVATFDEGLGEAVYVEAFDTGFAFVAAADEFDDCFG